MMSQKRSSMLTTSPFSLLVEAVPRMVPVLRMAAPAMLRMVVATQKAAPVLHQRYLETKSQQEALTGFEG